MVRTFSIRQALADAARLFGRNIFFFVGVAVISALVFMGLHEIIMGLVRFIFYVFGHPINYLSPNDTEQTHIWILSKTQSCWVGFSMSAFMTLVAWISIQTYKNKTVSTEDVYVPWRLLLIGTGMQSVLVAGIFFVLHGAYWLLSLFHISEHINIVFAIGMCGLVVFWAYTMLAVFAVIEGQDCAYSMKRSFEHVRSSLLKILILGALFGAAFFMIGISINLYLGLPEKFGCLFLGALYGILVLASVYKQLKMSDSRA